MSEAYKNKKKKLKEIKSRWDKLPEKYQYHKFDAVPRFKKGDMVCSRFDIKNVGIVSSIDKSGTAMTIYWIRDKTTTNRPMWHLQLIEKEEGKE